MGRSQKWSLFVDVLNQRPKSERDPGYQLTEEFRTVNYAVLGYVCLSVGHTLIYLLLGGLNWNTSQ